MRAVSLLFSFVGLLGAALVASASAGILTKEGKQIELTVINAAICTSEADLMRLVDLSKEFAAAPDDLSKKAAFEKHTSPLSSDRRCYLAIVEAEVPAATDLVAMRFTLIDQGRRLTIGDQKVVIIRGEITAFAFRGGRIDERRPSPIAGFTFANEGPFDALLSHIAMKGLDI